MSSPRRAVVEALIRQEQDGYSNLVLDSILEKSGLEGRDKAFAAALFYGTVERLVTLDFCLDQFLKKPVAKLDPPVRNILRSGLCQLRYMKVPSAAAVNESVKLTRQMGKSSAAGMVNAVLRRSGQLELDKVKWASPAQRLSVTCSVALPLVERLLDLYGERTGEILAATLVHPETTVRVNPLKTTREQLTLLLEQEGAVCRPGPVENSLVVKFRGSPAQTEEFRQGLYHVQGLPSQMAALALQARPGQKVADLCAAPGGKSALLAQEMENTGILFSRDLAPNRVPLIQSQLDRLGITCAQVARRDGTVYDPALAGMDRVLCDVPCSGLGIMAKKPDIRYKSLEGLEELTKVQQDILENGASYLKPGGRLVYSTCTILPQENQDRVRRFLAGHREFHLVPATFPGGEDTGAGILFLPGKDNPDGFFIAVMERD